MPHRKGRTRERYLLLLPSPLKLTHGKIVRVYTQHTSTPKHTKISTNRKRDNALLCGNIGSQFSILLILGLRLILGLILIILSPHFLDMGFPCGSAGEESACNAGDLGSIPGLGRPPGEGRLPTPLFWPAEFCALYSPGVCRVRHEWVTFTFTFSLYREMSVTSDMQMTSPLWQKAKRNWTASWWKWKRRVKKWV